MENKKIDRIIVHAGMHKTGSTAIQKALWNCQNEEFHYLRWNGNKNHSIPYLYAFADGGVHAKSDLERQKATQHGSELRQLLTQELDLVRSKNAIISGEAIGAARLGNGVKRLKDFLDPWANRFDVLLYVRPPRSYAAAEFSQSICGGGTPVLPIGIDYSGITELDKAFGPDVVSLLPYIRSKLGMRDVVYDFCSRVGIPMHEAQPNLANTSPSLELLSILWEVNSYFRSFPSRNRVHINEARYKVIRTLSKFGEQKFLISPAGIKNYTEIRRVLSDLSSRVGVDLGHDEIYNNEVEISDNYELKELSLSSSPLLVDYVYHLAETENLVDAQIAAKDSKAGRDLAAAQRIVIKMIEMEIERKSS